MINPYQSEVRSLSDEELRVLSEELSDEYQRSENEEGYWIDDAAEVRYWEMRHEIRRRWEVANPGWRLLPINQYCEEGIIRVLMDGMRSAQAFCGKEFTGRVGDLISVRKPARF